MFLSPFCNNSFVKEIKRQHCQLERFPDDNYFLIYVKANRIVCLYFILNGLNESPICHVNFSALSSDLLISLISRHKSLSQFISMSHALYLGKEIYKAELSRVCSQLYVQS